MSRPELTRLETLAQVQAGALSQRDAAARLGLSERQVRRLERRLEEGGPAALGDRTTPISAPASPTKNCASCTASYSRPRRCAKP
jgi:transposase